MRSTYTSTINNTKLLTGGYAIEHNTFLNLPDPCWALRQVANRAASISKRLNDIHKNRDWAHASIGASLCASPWPSLVEPYNKWCGAWCSAIEPHNANTH